MAFLMIYGLIGFIILIYMVSIWLASLVLKNSSIVDIFWGPGFVLSAWSGFLLTPDGFSPRKLLICILVTIWGLRLSIHILSRNWKKPEDFRYAKWRQETGKKWWWRSFFKVFLLQGMLLWIISIPLLFAQYSPGTSFLTLVDVLAAILWLIGFFFESVGDWQLTKFKSDPASKGHVMNKGVWKFTRHPNYFGDSAQWWGYYLISISAGGFWTIFSPILMTLLLIKVSGVALLEKSLKESRPGYKEYMETTNAFIPWFPHKKR